MFEIFFESECSCRSEKLRENPRFSSHTALLSHLRSPVVKKYKENRLTLMRLIFAVIMAINRVHFVWVLVSSTSCVILCSFPNGNSEARRSNRPAFERRVVCVCIIIHCSINR